MKRLEEFIAIIGAPGRGKTTALINTIKAKLRAGERTIVIVPDQSESAWFPYYPVINAESLKEKFNVNFKGILIVEYEEKLTFPFLYNLLQNGIIKNLNIVFDDPFYVEEGRPEKALMRIIKRRRQYSADVFTTSHSMDNIPKVFFPYLTAFGLLPTDAPIENRVKQVSKKIIQHKEEIDDIGDVKFGHKNYHYMRWFRRNGELLFKSKKQ